MSQCSESPILSEERTVDSSFRSISVNDDDTVAAMMKRELLHKPASNYVHILNNDEATLSERNDAVAWMGKLHSRFGFRPVCAYLAINYMDRFLSSCRLACFKSQPWTTQLLSVTCVSLAAKVEEVEVPPFMELQVDESRHFFDPKALRKMELAVLTALKWRMHAITPFSFIDHFIDKLNTYRLPPLLLTSRSVRIILSVINGFEFLRFRPSEIAAAVAIAVLGDTRTLGFEDAMGSLNSGLKKERVRECMKMVRNWDLVDGFGVRTSGLALSAPRSPGEVLDAGCFSRESDELDETADVDVSSYSSIMDSAGLSSPSSKRRKSNGQGED